MRVQHLWAAALLLSGCGNSNVPLNADERRMVDSISAAMINIARRDLDSLCKQEKTTVLPVLVDSIKKVRIEQIERQLKAIPK